VLICGDSFSADWTIKYDGMGWPNLLSYDFKITNNSQAGCSEYNIYKQLKMEKLDSYEHVIVMHTSPYRLHVNEHPVHNNDPLHHNSALIYTDIKEHSKTNPKLTPIIDYYEKYFNVEHALFVHNLLCKEIEQMCPKNTIHIINIECDECYKFNRMMNFYKIFSKNRGLLNHFNDKGNEIVYSKIKQEICNDYNLQ
jgi:hypothetical protein